MKGTGSKTKCTGRESRLRAAGKHMKGSFPVANITDPESFPILRERSTTATGETENGMAMERPSKDPGKSLRQCGGTATSKESSND